MIRSVVKSVARIIAVLFLVTVGVFLIMPLLPGDPAVAILGERATPEQIEQLRAELNLDAPLIERYGDWISNVLQGDLGQSALTKLAVSGRIADAFPVTFQLMIMSIVIALVIAVPLGLLSAYRPNRLFDRMSTVLSITFISIPPFVLGLVLIIVAAVKLDLFPTFGYVRLSEDPVGNLQSLALPALTLGLGLAAEYQRLLRADAVTTLQQDYVLFARSKGLSTWHVLTRHALRPSLASVVTLMGMHVGRLLAGSVIVESIFALPGLGLLALNSVTSRDIIQLQGVILVAAVVYVSANILTDVANAALDPRTRSAY